MTEDRIAAIPMMLTESMQPEGVGIFLEEIDQWIADNLAGKVELFWVDVPAHYPDDGWSKKLYFATFGSYEDMLHFSLRWL